MQKPKVLILLGSDSDLNVIEDGLAFLDKAGVSSMVDISSAHRDPEKTVTYAKNARKEGIEVIIAVAGMAAHLPGVIASHTTLPVIGVPASGGVLKGKDALYSIVQMPKGIPVASVGIDGYAGPSGGNDFVDFLFIRLEEEDIPDIAALARPGDHDGLGIALGRKRRQLYGSRPGDELSVYAAEGHGAAGQEIVVGGEGKQGGDEAHDEKGCIEGGGRYPESREGEDFVVRVETRRGHEGSCQGREGKGDGDHRGKGIEEKQDGLVEGSVLGEYVLGQEKNLVDEEDDEEEEEGDGEGEAEFADDVEEGCAREYSQEPKTRPGGHWYATS